MISSGVRSTTKKKKILDRRPGASKETLRIKLGTIKVLHLKSIRWAERLVILRILRNNV